MIAKNIENLSLAIKLQEAFGSPINGGLRRKAASLALIERLRVRRATDPARIFKSVYAEPKREERYQTGSVRSMFLYGFGH